MSAPFRFIAGTMRSRAGGELRAVIATSLGRDDRNCCCDRCYLPLQESNAADFTLGIASIPGLERAVVFVCRGCATPLDYATARAAEWDDPVSVADTDPRFD